MLKSAGYKLPATTKLTASNNNNNTQLAQFTANNLPVGSYSLHSVGGNNLEVSINELVELSAIAASESNWILALEKARQAAESLKALAASKDVFELSVMANSNLAAQLRNSKQLREAIQVYTSLVRMPASGAPKSGDLGASAGLQSDEKQALLQRFGLNIGNIYHQLADHKRALKYYRITLDCLASLPSGQMKQLQVKIMSNISLALLEESKAKQHSDELLSALNLLLADNLSSPLNQDQSSATQTCNANHHKFALNLIVCYYLRSQLSNMMNAFKSLVSLDICHQYRRALHFKARASVGSLTSGSGGLTVEAHARDGSFPKENSDESRNRAPIRSEEQAGCLQEPQSIAESNHNDEQLRQLLSCCERDKLEEAIERREEQVARCLMSACNLMLELERRSASKSPFSLADYLSGLLSDSGDAFHKSLVCLLRTNSASELLASEQLDKAIGELKSIQSESAISLNAENRSLIKSNLCLLRLLLNNLPEAIELGEEALNSGNPKAHVNLANCHLKSNNLSTAKRFYEKNLTSFEANYNLALISRKLEEETNSILSSSELLRKRGFILPSIQTALIYKQSGKVAPAIETLNELIRSSRQAPEVYLMASRLLEESGKDSGKKAISLLQQANREHPYQLALLERLIALNINNYNYKAAKALILECIRNRPDQVRWYQMLAECYRRAADYGRAMEIYKLASERFARDTSCLKALIKLAEELGLSDERGAFEAKLARITSATSTGSLEA